MKKRHEGAITATTAEAERYKSYVEYMNGLGNKAITFGEWLEKDRAPKGDPDIESDRRLHREAGDGHDEFS